MEQRMIAKLEKHVIEQIAAGEVVQRPVSVVKELIENSIDAGSTRIEIKIKNGGKQLIEISDNGYGMSKDDAILAFERHSTSKIRTVDDLNRLSTLGFRGEALASISVVSKVLMITRSPTSEIGTKIVIEGGDITKVEPVGCSEGTTITVNALFYNVPARRKFLKKDQREQALIYDIVAQYSLIFPHIAFQLSTDKRSLIKSPIAVDPRDKIIYIYGNEIARNLIRIDCSSPIKVEGYLSKPQISYRSRDRLHIYVSSRLIKSKILEDTVIAAYQRLLPKDRYPFCVLNIDISPEQIDVNIHPGKREIRFHNERTLRKNLFKSFKDALWAADLRSEILPEDIPRPILGETDLSTRMSSYPQNNHIESTDQVQFSTLSPEKIPESSTHKKFESLASETNIIPTIQTQFIPKAPRSLEKPFEPVPEILNMKLRDLPWTPLGVIKNSYIVAFDDANVYFIDQYAAYERIMFDELTEQVRQSTIKSQILLEPIKMTLLPPRAKVLEDNLTLLSEYGFMIENFGRDTFLIRAVPVIYGYVLQKQALDDLIDELLEKGDFTSLPSEKEIVQSIACHSVPRAGDPLTSRQIVILLKRLYNSKDIFTCPHGRPIVIKLRFHDLNKSFLRI